MANPDRCLEVLNFLEANKANHQQTTWVQGMVSDTQPTEDNMCGTTLCVAGAAMMLQGEIMFDRKELPSGEKSRYWFPFVKTNRMQRWRDADEYSGWRKRGARILGLNEIEAEYLFFNCTNAQALEALRRGAKGERIIPQGNLRYKRAYPEDAA